MPDRPAVFLDRDGVINEELNYVHRIEDFRFLPGVLDSCRRLSRSGYLLVVITNQAGIARGYYDVATFETLTRWMRQKFSDACAPLAAVYYCPHHPDAAIPMYRGSCDCRKPAPGMLLRAQRELHIDLGRSVMVGDKLSDIEAGAAAGVGRLFLLTTRPLEHTGDGRTTLAAQTVADLSVVADLLASESGRSV
jgi:D-glycero-D-manno-heptose 1,7-bisphosphate phosphatase